MLYSSSSDRDIEICLNRDLLTLSQWAEEWGVTFNHNKTEALFISNRVRDWGRNLVFNGTPVNIVDHHKHLGVVLSANGKWSEHITKICSTANKQLGGLRKLKYLLNRCMLLKIYRTYILPLLEYACEVWDGCSVEDSNNIEKVQLEAARIATGLPSYASRDSLYFETDLEPLYIRRERRKLCLFYKIKNNLVPTYLTEMLPPTFETISPYNLRGRSNYVPPNLRLTQSQNSFLPSTIRLWNDLPDSVKNAENFARFKNTLKTKSQVEPVSKYRLLGDRKFNILLTKLRHKCSALNADLYRVNLVQSPVCPCGHHCEDASHFFLECNLYIELRRTLLMNLANVTNINLYVILYGNENLLELENEQIFLYIKQFVLQSRRFG